MGAALNDALAGLSRPEPRRCSLEILARTCRLSRLIVTDMTPLLARILAPGGEERRALWAGRSRAELRATAANVWILRGAGGARIGPAIGSPIFLPKTVTAVTVILGVLAAGGHLRASQSSLKPRAAVERAR